MASFERYYKSDIGSGEQTVHTSNASDSSQADIIIGMLLSNSGLATATASAYVDAGGDTKVYLCRNISIPSGGSVEIVQGKIVLANLDEVKAVCSSGAIDCWLSVLDNASA
jgi:ApbE superfamily uncharacterized protein (UPF0280 family)